MSNRRATRSPIRLNGQHREEQHQAGEQRGPPCLVDELAVLGDHQPPRRLRRLDAVAEEGQRRPRPPSRMATPVKQHRHERRHDVGQDLPEQHARRPGAEAAGRQHVLALGQAERLGPHDAGDRGERQHGEHERDRPRVADPAEADAEDLDVALAQRLRPPDDEGREDERRERQQGVGEDRDRPVDPAAAVAGDHAERRADDQADDDAGDADDQRDPGAVDAAGEDVAAEAVAAEPEVGARAEGVVAGAVDALVGQADERQVVGEDGEERRARAARPRRRRRRVGIRRRRSARPRRPGPASAARVAVGATSVTCLILSRATWRGGCAGRRPSTAGRR